MAPTLTPAAEAVLSDWHDGVTVPKAKKRAMLAQVEAQARPAPDPERWRIERLVAALEAGEHPLVGVTEIAQRASTSAGTVHSWRTRGIGFPEPVAELATGPVWLWPDVQAWLAIPRPPGRPRKAARAGA